MPAKAGCYVALIFLIVSIVQLTPHHAANAPQAIQNQPIIRLVAPKHFSLMFQIVINVRRVTPVYALVARVASF
jgi:hypothetical protein